MSQRRYWTIVVALGVLFAALYLSFAPSRLSRSNYGVDSGDFLSAMITAGIPHPTGYPTYTAFGWVIQHIPFSTPYFRGVLLSAVPAAVALVLLMLWVNKWLLETRPFAEWLGILAGLLLGSAPLFWSQAVIVEVHGLQMLFVVLGLWWFTALLHPGWIAGHKTLMILISLALGLGMGNHITLIFLLPAWLIAARIGRRRGMRREWFIWQGLAFVAGTLIYLYLPLRARTYPPINWGNPQTLKGFWWLISAQAYQQLAFSAPLPDLASRVAVWAALIREQFGIPGLVLGVVGAIQYPYRDKTLRWLLLGLIVVYSVFAIGYHTKDSVVYLLPVHMVYAIWIALGLAVIGQWEVKEFPLGSWLILGIFVYVFARIPMTYRQVNPRNDTRPADFAEEYLAEAPEDAILITSSDADTFPLWYYHFGLKWRPDVAVIVAPLTRFNWYQKTLQRTYTDLEFPPPSPQFEGDTNWWLNVLALNPHRPVCISRVLDKDDWQIDYQCRPPQTTIPE
jgi:hypothetical protein